MRMLCERLAVRFRGHREARRARDHGKCGFRQSGSWVRPPVWAQRGTPAPGQPACVGGDTN
jgi:hypothetical protein